MLSKFLKHIKKSFLTENSDCSCVFVLHIAIPQSNIEETPYILRPALRAVFFIFYLAFLPTSFDRFDELSNELYHEKNNLHTL